MIQLLLIVVPCAVVGTAAVLIVQRSGWLPRIESSAPTRSSIAPSAHQPYRTFEARSPEWGLRPFAIAALVLMAAWIVFWLVLLVIGLNIIGRAS